MPKDPYRYFRIEAREIVEGLGRGMLELEKDGAEQARVESLLRLAHTLKGAARVVRQPGIATLAHELEDGLAEHRSGTAPVSRERVAAFLRMLDAIAAQLTSLDQPQDGERPSTPRPAVDEPFETVRVAIAEMDTVLDGISETGFQMTVLRQEIAGLERARQLAAVLADQLSFRPGSEHGNGLANGRTAMLAAELRADLDRLLRALTTSADQTATELAQVRDAANQLRLLPANVLFAPLERAAHDVAQSLGKRIAFEAAGGETRLDTHVLTALRAALLHAVRNAVAHGIEAETERAALGKPPVGRVELRVERRGGQVAFVCRDDGRGIDVEAVRQAAVSRGLLTAARAASLSLEDVMRLVLHGGVTTTSTVTEVSGRGVGLDVVRETADRLKGAVTVRSEPRGGTTVEIRVPVSLAAVSALAVGAAGMVASIPLEAVRRTVRITDADITRTPDGASIVCDGTVVPFVPLARALGRGIVPERERRGWSAVIVQAENGAVAVGVDRLLGTANVVLRPLPSLITADALVAGAALDAAGDPQMVLDPTGLVAAVRASDGVPATAVEPPPPVLVIDDSLTTRMLEQSILESAGYEVHLATSAEEGLAKARERRYGLFLVDVEMPGMNGFDFVARTRADPALGDVPAILVTSRDSPGDRDRGAQAGAHAYIVKSEFNQTQLLHTIRELIG